MLQPVRTKYRKAFKGRIHGNAARAVKLNYGQFGLKAVQPERYVKAGRPTVISQLSRLLQLWPYKLPFRHP